MTAALAIAAEPHPMAVLLDALLQYPSSTHAVAWTDEGSDTHLALTVWVETNREHVKIDPAVCVAALYVQRKSDFANVFTLYLKASP